MFKGGRLKDMTGFWRGPTAEEGEKFQGLINEIYDNFVAVVAQGRPLDEGQVRELATGEVFTARRGNELGLVDELGDFQDALELAARLGSIRPRPLMVRPKRSIGQRMFGGMGNRSSALPPPRRPAPAVAGRRHLLPGAVVSDERLLAGG